MRSQPPASMDDLWPMLRVAGLLDDEQLSRLTSAWEDGPVRPRLDQLVQAGVLTAYQAEQILMGKLGRLRLGPYRILDRLGSGGSAQVFKAEHVLMKRLVALKVLGRVRRRQRALSIGDSPPRRTSTELETVGRLSHPHIVAAYDAARLRGRLVLVLEYVDGIDLERLVSEAGALPAALACEVVRQTAPCAGLPARTPAGPSRCQTCQPAPGSRPSQRGGGAASGGPASRQTGGPGNHLPRRPERRAVVRHHGLHRSRTRNGQRPGRHPGRPLQPGLHVLSLADRTGAFSGRLVDGQAVAPPPGRAGAGAGAAPRRAGRRGRHCQPPDGAQSRRPLSRTCIPGRGPGASAIAAHPQRADLSGACFV